jgi:hypothetical protein
VRGGQVIHVEPADLSRTDVSHRARASASSRRTKCPRGIRSGSGPHSRTCPCPCKWCGPLHMAPPPLSALVTDVADTKDRRIEATRTGRGEVEDHGGQGVLSSVCLVSTTKAFRFSDTLSSEMV